MRFKSSLFVLMCGLFFFLFASTIVGAADYPKGAVEVKLEGAKMAPVSFSHETHATKAKVDCVKCHHADAQSPKACTTCHKAEAKDKAPGAKDAFHKTCQGCHKDAAAKGAKAPTKCNECHKK